MIDYPINVLREAINAERHNVGWAPFDQAHHSDLDEWEQVHGHDVRLKCYPEYGCQVIESAAINAHLNTLEALLDWADELAHTDYRGNEPKEFAYVRHLRRLVTAALLGMEARLPHPDDKFLAHHPEWKV